MADIVEKLQRSAAMAGEDHYVATHRSTLLEAADVIVMLRNLNRELAREAEHG